MILNKFRPLLGYNALKTLGFQLLALSLFSCNKTSNIYANKAFISITHVAYGVGPISTSLDGTPLYPGSLAFGLTTGDSLNPYDTTVSRISEMLIQESTDTLLFGNQAFQQQRSYSIFIYDTLDKSSVNMIILQDYPSGGLADTITNVRFMNFSPGTSIGFKLINNRKFFLARDTIVISPKLFVGYNPSPSIYNFSQILVGNYTVFAFADSSSPAADSSNFKNLGLLQIDTSINYNVYFQGFTNDSSSGPNRFQLKSVPLN